MALAPGQTTGGPENRHESADQWLLVLSGSGSAEIDGERSDLRPGVVLLIEAGERHEIRNRGDEPLRTFSVYAPPAY